MGLDLLVVSRNQLCVLLIQRKHSFFIVSRHLWLMIPLDHLAHMRLEFLYPGLGHAMGVTTLRLLHIRYAND